MCQVLEVSRSGYYSWRRSKKSNRETQNEQLVERIKRIHKQSKRAYGSPRITEALRREGECYGKHRIARLMRLEGIAGVGKKKFKVTTDSHHKKAVYENIVGQRFEADRPNQLWTSDITYLWTKQGWLYLSVILDVYSRMIVGWSLQATLQKRLVLDALEDAIAVRRPPVGLIFHSDRGSQYASEEVRRMLERNEIRGSMSGKGNCYDNAITESFFRSLKTELVYQHIFPTRSVARMMVFDYLEVFYNRQRLHSSIGYMSPVQYERRMVPRVGNQLTLS
jgi:putative transposase